MFGVSDDFKRLVKAYEEFDPSVTAILSKKQIVSRIINLMDAKRNLDPISYNQVFALYKKYYNEKTKIKYDAINFMAAYNNMIDSFEQIAPWELYNGEKRINISDKIQLNVSEIIDSSLTVMYDLVYDIGDTKTIFPNEPTPGFAMTIQALALFIIDNWYSNIAGKWWNTNNIFSLLNKKIEASITKTLEDQLSQNLKSITCETKMSPEELIESTKAVCFDRLHKDYNIFYEMTRYHIQNCSNEITSIDRMLAQVTLTILSHGNDNRQIVIEFYNDINGENNPNQKQGYSGLIGQHKQKDIEELFEKIEKLRTHL